LLPFYQQQEEVELAKETQISKANSEVDSQLQNNSCGVFQKPVSKYNPTKQFSLTLFILVVFGCLRSA
jgi:hypothetical protein